MKPAPPVTSTCVFAMSLVSRSVLTEHYDDQEDDDSGEYQEGDLPCALRILARHPTGHAVDHDLIGPRAEIVGEQPDRHEDVLERPARINGMDLKVAIGVAGNLRRAHGAQLVGHR